MKYFSYLSAVVLSFPTTSKGCVSGFWKDTIPCLTCFILGLSLSPLASWIASFIRLLFCATGGLSEYVWVLLSYTVKVSMPDMYSTTLIALNGMYVLMGLQEKHAHCSSFLGLRKWCVWGAPPVVNLGHWLLGIVYNPNHDQYTSYL